jgi:FtsP/CotA-like multicopper oxidase with cupredoxin domain
MLVFAGSAQASTCPTSNVIQDPPEFVWTPPSGPGGYWSGTLEIGEAIDLPIGGDSLTTRAYRQEGGQFSIPGPTIRMTPGEKYVLTFKNTLEYEVPSPVHNDLKDPNITNIHTHGLHVSGKTPADDITRLINGGFCGDYVYEVPGDHMGGTLWYHAHHHGSTYLQVAGGAFGLLIINDKFDGIPGDEASKVGVAGMTERLLAIGYLDPNVAGAGGDTLVGGTLSPTWTVNGLVGGSLCTPAGETLTGEWQHWRVLLADRDARLKTLSVGPECEAVLLARDGVWRTVAPLDLPTNSIELTGASRADLAVRCSVDSTISVNGETVANVVADSGLDANTDVGPYDFVGNPTDGTWSANRPEYLRRDLSEETQVENRSVNMGARTVNGKKFDVNEPTFTIKATSVQEWNIKGARQHPFHKHIYHVQMQGDCGPFEDGEYYDTVAGNCLVRFDLNPTTSSVYDGITIMHCHILLHEDEGAMGWTDVDGGILPPAFPDPFNQFVLYDVVADACDTSACTEPGQESSCADGLDNDCDSFIDGDDPDCQVSCTDIDGDTYSPDGGSCGPFDCDDNDSAINPGADEVCDDFPVDNDCDGAIDGDDPDCQASVDCTEQYGTNRNACNDDPACKWSGKNKICVNQ